MGRKAVIENALAYEGVPATSALCAARDGRRQAASDRICLTAAANAIALTIGPTLSRAIAVVTTSVEHRPGNRLAYSPNLVRSENRSSNALLGMLTTIREIAIGKCGHSGEDEGSVRRWLRPPATTFAITR